jgi:LuxR family maltose regulon positive regulatory protein
MLATKFFIPSPRGNWIARPRLTQRLDEGRERKLTLISAPAGFGKTTLLSSWIDQRHLAVAWLSLDVGDNDPRRFLAYLIAALETRHAGIGETAASLLQSTQRSLESVVTLLINALSTLPDEITLVLDDYHLVDAPAVHSTLTFLLDHAPPQLHLIIATRVDPHVPLARLRARGELMELRAADLRFTANEASAFLDQVMVMPLAPEQFAALEERIEGWIAGLQLAALSLQGRDAEHIAAFIHAFTGSHHYIMDYLVEEVLGRQREQIQTFLLQTSILDRLNGPLCDAVTGQNDSHTVLESLERANLFLIPLEEERRWYRYHHLFADLLRYRLQQSQPERVPELHRRASEWYERNGLAAEAIQHALVANDFERAAGLVEQIGETIWMRGEVRTLLGWLDALPDAVVCAHARLCLYYAWMHVLEGQIKPAQRRLKDAEKVSEQTSAEEQGVLVAIGGAIAYLQGDSSRSVELSEQALQRLPEDNAIWRGVTTINLGIAYRLAGDIRAASRNFSKAMRMSQTADNWHATLMALIDLGDTYELQGQLHHAAGLYQEALDSATERGAQRLPLMAEAHERMGKLRYEWNELASAAQHLTEGIDLSQSLENMLALGYLAFARVLQAQRDLPGARAMMQKAETLALSHNMTVRTVADVEAGRVRLWVTQGNVSAATQWAHAFGLRVEDGSEKSAKSPIWYEVLQIALVRVLIAQQHPAEAQSLLARLLQAAEAGGRIGHMIEMLTLHSLASQAQGDTIRALATLERALSLAEPEGYIRTFVDEGEPMAKLLGRMNASREVGGLKDYLRQLLFAFGKQETLHPLSLIAAPALVEPLSERELQVLRLVAAGASNREIAKALIITVGTVKAHMHNIYGKLGVQSRTQAIARARELHLL